MGYSPWDHKESDMTELLTRTHYRGMIKSLAFGDGFNIQSLFPPLRSREWDGWDFQSQPSKQVVGSTGC